jgi:hypothetical protein
METDLGVEPTAQHQKHAETFAGQFRSLPSFTKVSFSRIVLPNDRAKPPRHPREMQTKVLTPYNFHSSQAELLKKCT